MREQTWAFETDESSVHPPRSGVSSAGYSTGTALRLPSSAVVVPREFALAEGWGSGVSRACGPALRLTSSRPASAGAVWYGRDVTVGEVGVHTELFSGESFWLSCVCKPRVKVCAKQSMGWNAHRKDTEPLPGSNSSCCISSTIFLPCRMLLDGEARHV